MNKQIQAMISTYGLEFDATDGFWGKVNDIQVSGVYSPWSQVVSVAFHVYVSEENKAKVEQYLAESKKAYRLNAYGMDGDGINCLLANFPKKYVAFIEEFTAFLKGISSAETCPICGQTMEEGSRLCGTNYGRYRCHEHCFDEFESRARALQAEQTAGGVSKSSYLKAAAGAAIGALVGCALWVILFVVGYLSAVTPFVGALAAAALWDKFGGRNDKFKIIAIWLITFVFLALTIFITYIVYINNALIETGTVGNAFTWFSYFMENDEEFQKEFLSNTLTSLLFFIVGNATVTFQIIKSQRSSLDKFMKY